MFQKYLLSSVLRSPDEPSGDGDAAVIETPAVDAVADAPIVETPAVDAPAQTKKPWFLDRISQESAKAQQASERATAAEARAAAAEALAQRLQAGKADPANDDPAPRRSAPASGDRAAEIQHEAAKQRLYEDAVDVKNKGITQFGPAFGEALNILTAVGATSDDFVADVLAVDKTNAHVLLDKIAKDPEKAVALTQMNQRQRIAELTRMSVLTTAAPAAKADPVVEAKPAARTVSKAPPPPPRVDPSASKVVDGYSDEASDEDFTAKFNERMKARSGRR